jgi:hypothetical protein
MFALFLHRQRRSVSLSVALCVQNVFPSEGNSNRFVSIKNCYEICHPSEASVKKPRVLSAIRAYLIPSRKGDECPKPPTTPAPREVVVRHIPHPLDPSKTLTIVQNAKYIERPKEFRFGIHCFPVLLSFR